MFIGIKRNHDKFNKINLLKLIISLSKLAIPILNALHMAFKTFLRLQQVGNTHVACFTYGLQNFSPASTRKMAPQDSVAGPTQRNNADRLPVD